MSVHKTVEKKLSPHFIKEFISVLTEEDLRRNCNVCTKRRAGGRRSSVATYEQCTRMCQICMFSISRRKHAYLYICEYLSRFNKTFFKVERIRRYIEEECVFADIITPGIKIVLADLVGLGLIKIRKQTMTNKHYTIERTDVPVLKTKLDYCTTRAFGIFNGRVPSPVKELMKVKT